MGGLELNCFDAYGVKPTPNLHGWPFMLGPESLLLWQAYPPKGHHLPFHRVKSWESYFVGSDGGFSTPKLRTSEGHKNTQQHED